MRLNSWIFVAGLAVASLMASVNGAAAAGSKATGPGAAAVGATWDTNVKGSVLARGNAAGETYDEQQMAIIQRVTDYFQNLDKVKGRFVQTGADKKRMRGKFYIKRPGRFRFDYNRPSRMVILSNGRKLIIQDHDLNTEDEIALKKTPFRMLLRKNVNLLRDARITQVQESADLVLIELLDKNPRITGGIKLIFTKLPQFELKEWVTTDVQGLKTRIELTKFIRVKKLSSKLFIHKSIAFPNFGQN